MHRSAAICVAAVALTVAADFASASEVVSHRSARADRCAPAPGEPFRSEADLRATVEGFGYQVVRVGTDAGCYAVVAADRRGRLFDIRFEGANLHMVSRYPARQGQDVLANR